MKAEEIRSNDDLFEYIRLGNDPEYCFFYGHSVPKDGSVKKTCFSQWYPATFEVDSISYLTAEHYMMAEKARLFEDEETLKKILTASHPKTAKSLGRKVKNFDQEKWSASCFSIVVTGNEAKFSQNDDMKSFLLNTKSSIIVEASPTDRIWGIGLSQKSPAVNDPRCWRGRNLLGYALMEVRARLSR